MESRIMSSYISGNAWEPPLSIPHKKGTERHLFFGVMFFTHWKVALHVWGSICVQDNFLLPRKKGGKHSILFASGSRGGGPKQIQFHGHDFISYFGTWVPHPSCPASLSVGFVACGGRGGKEDLIFFFFFSPIFVRGIEGAHGRGGPYQKETSRVILVVR